MLGCVQKSQPTRELDWGLGASFGCNNYVFVRFVQMSPYKRGPERPQGLMQLRLHGCPRPLTAVCKGKVVEIMSPAP